VLNTGPAGGTLNSSFRTRDTDQYKLELGLAIVNIARIVPDGVLVFFPSYNVMTSCVEAWHTLGDPAVWYDTCGRDIPCNSVLTVVLDRDRLQRLKHLVVEPRDAAAFAAARFDFESKLDGACALQQFVRRAIADATCIAQTRPEEVLCFSLSAAAKLARGLISQTEQGEPLSSPVRIAVLVVFCRQPCIQRMHHHGRLASAGIPYAMKTDPKARWMRRKAHAVCGNSRVGTPCR
jgi:hypothetical protein